MPRATPGEIEHPDGSKLPTRLTKETNNSPFERGWTLAEPLWRLKLDTLSNAPSWDRTRLSRLPTSALCH
ncbi:hypothetical protein SK128_021465 [Halocaridina rubra]|uniref:Uncharacterized protein n=1 Tax=Halocaridina rubra TaxID=373956 RepID=A0AAN8ZWG1_HALRR